eukprot:COSAG02_NODE_12167_length_1585_cov_6.890310_2_plen_108_part_00
MCAQAFDYRRSRDAPPVLSSSHMEPEPAADGLTLVPAPDVVTKWPAELEFMPADEQEGLKQEVALARQRYTEGSPMMNDERTRLERKYCIDAEVLVEVFAYIAIQAR